MSVSVKDTSSSIYSAFSFFPIACISYSYCWGFLHFSCSFVISMSFPLLFNVFCYSHSLCIPTSVDQLPYVYFVASCYLYFLYIFMSDFQLYRIMTVVCGYEIYVEFQIQFF